MEEETPIRLDTIADGAAEALFQAELQRVLQNIADPNTDAEATREITIKVRWSPTEERTMAPVRVFATSKLAPVSPAGTVVYIGRRGGKLIAVENNPKQLTLDTAAPPAPTPLRAVQPPASE